MHIWIRNQSWKIFLSISANFIFSSYRQLQIKNLWWRDHPQNVSWYRRIAENSSQIILSIYANFIFLSDRELRIKNLWWRGHPKNVRSYRPKIKSSFFYRFMQILFFYLIENCPQINFDEGTIAKMSTLVGVNSCQSANPT